MEGRLEKALIEFIERIAKGEATSEAEVQVLPEVAMALAKLLPNY